MPTNNNICQEVNKLSVSGQKKFVLYGTMTNILAILQSPCAGEAIWSRILLLILEGFICTTVLVVSFHFDMFNSRRYGELKR